MPDTPGTPRLTPADLADLGRVWEEHRPRLLEYAARRLDRSLATRLDADDILNDAFLDSIGKWPRFRAGSGLSSYVWLYGIVRDRIIEAWRHENRDVRAITREQPWPDQSSIQLGLSLLHPATDPLDAAVREEQHRKMREAMEELSDDERELLWMRAYDKLSYREIGQVFDIAENAASARHARALLRLKGAWAARSGESLRSP